MSLPESTDSVKLITDKLIKDLIQRAEQSPRKRMNFNFHPSLEDNPHRFMNVMLRDTYITPHRHLKPPKSESFVILDGAVAFIIFEDDGRIRETHTLGHSPGASARGIDIAPGIYHTLAVLTPHAVCFEVKPGPYEVTTDKEFAPWAPAEGDAGCADYLRELINHHNRVKPNLAKPGTRIQPRPL